MQNWDAPELSVDRLTLHYTDGFFAYAPELEERIRPHLRSRNDSWRVDETYIKVKGKWKYLDRGVDSSGQTIDFFLSAKHDRRAGQRFFCKASKATHTRSFRVINTDKKAASKCW